MLPCVCCKTENNILFKSCVIGKDGMYTNYVTSKELGEEINDIGVLYPVFNLIYFLSAKNFKDVLKIVLMSLTEQEEKYNENVSSELIASIEKLKINVKDSLYEINKKSFNIKRDILKHTEALNKLLVMKQTSVNKKDTLRFNVERLIMETEEKIDLLHSELIEQRNSINNIVLGYKKWINRGKKMN